MISFEELSEAVKPILDLIQRKGDYHTVIQVSKEKIIVLQEEVGIPIE